MTGRPSRSIDARLSRERWRLRAFRVLILSWFRSSGRHFPWRNPSATGYALVVSEILLQRTRAETVAGFFRRFVKRFPGWKQLALATEDELRAFLEPIGLWRRRSASLRALAAEMRGRRGLFPTTREELEALPGVGQYVASAVMVFCHGKREPLLDVNMARVLERVFSPRTLVDIRYDPWLQALARAVVNHPRAREINWAVLDLAATTCKIRNPRCETCPLVGCCRFARRSGRTSEATQLSAPTVTAHSRR
jgi:A/G-specific adenine glycosylase